MFRREWLYEHEFKDWLSGVPGEEVAYCKVCDKDFLCNGKSKLRSHANGLRHKSLIRESRRYERQESRRNERQESRRNERQVQRTSSSRNQLSRVRIGGKSPTLTTLSYSSRIQARQWSPMSMASFSSRMEIRERVPISGNSYSRSSPSPDRRQVQLEREIFAATFSRSNPAARSESFGFARRPDFLPNSENEDTERRFGFYD